MGNGIAAEVLKWTASNSSQVDDDTQLDRDMILCCHCLEEFDGDEAKTCPGCDGDVCSECYYNPDSCPFAELPLTQALTDSIHSPK